MFEWLKVKYNNTDDECTKHLKATDVLHKVYFCLLFSILS